MVQQQQQQLFMLHQQQQQQQQYIVAPTADGQQLLVQLPPGDSGSINGTVMAAILASPPLAWDQFAAAAAAQQQQLSLQHPTEALANVVLCTPGSVAAPALVLQHEQQQQVMDRMAGGHKQLQQSLAEGYCLSSPTASVKRGDLFVDTSPQPKVRCGAAGAAAGAAMQQHLARRTLSAAVCSSL
jgi:hypothetical protein